ncbi:MAG: DUF6152 family protein [Gammaproteobacteria bacterium]|nr:DUF6152 family protein [Gammaproteobacteria bacterium]
MLSRNSIFAATAVFFLAVPASAHHSHIQYDMTEYTHVEGVVAEVHWFNPHAWLYVTTTGEDGEPVIWALEATGPGGLQRNGITRDMVNVGDTISARCHQLLDGSNGCLLGYLTGADGVERLWD